MQPNSPTDAELEAIADRLIAYLSSDQGDAIDQALAALKDVRDRCQPAPLSADERAGEAAETILWLIADYNHLAGNVIALPPAENVAAVIARAARPGEAGEPTDACEHCADGMPMSALDSHHWNGNREPPKCAAPQAHSKWAEFLAWLNMRPPMSPRELHDAHATWKREDT